jgi:hypothetical protein
VRKPKEATKEIKAVEEEEKVKEVKEEKNGTRSEMSCNEMRRFVGHGFSRAEKLAGLRRL